MTNYERAGSGTVLVFVHGWGDNLKTFDALTMSLIKHYEVIRMDLPGFGATEAPKQTWNLDNYAQFLTDFLAKIDIHDYVLAGHSNGGAVIIRGISLEILQPNKLILLAASGVRDKGSIGRLFIKIIAKVGKVLTFWLPRTKRLALQKKLYGTVGSDMLVAPQLQETFKQTVRQDVQQDANTITVPTLLIYGDQDKATPVDDVGKPLANCITNSKLIIIPGLDHFVQLQPDKIMPALEEFL